MWEVRIAVGQGRFTVVDPSDVDRVQQHAWRAYRFGARLYYATTRINGKTIYLHRFLTDAPAGMDVDHRDGDGLNNRRENLRVIPHQMNIANQRLSRANSSGFKGVSRMQQPPHRSPRWFAQTKSISAASLPRKKQHAPTTAKWSSCSGSMHERTLAWGSWKPRVRRSPLPPHPPPRRRALPRAGRGQ